MVNHSVTTVLFGLLKQSASQEILLSDEILLQIHSILAKIGPKGEFVVKSIFLLLLNFLVCTFSGFFVIFLNCFIKIFFSL